MANPSSVRLAEAMEAEEEAPLRGGVRRVTLSEGQRFCVTGLSLADPAAARCQRLVRVWAEVGGEARTRLLIGVLRSEQPLTSSEPPLELADREFVLRHDSAASSIRLYGYYLDPPSPNGGGGSGGPTRRRFLEDMDVDDLPEEEEEEEEEVVDVGVEYEPLTEEDLAERYDSDNSEDDESNYGDGEEEEEEEEEDQAPRKVRIGEASGESSSRRKSFPLVAAPAGIVVPDGVYLGPALFAAVINTVGFMKIAAADAGGVSQGREIVVLYRYTRFSRTWSGRRGVEACRRTKLHWLRFAVPPAGEMATSLAWAGSSLCPLIYPGLFRQQLQDLWSSLAALVTTTIPPQAARLQVIVDVGILRREDHTAERMGHMRGALEAIMGEAWPEYYHVGMELQLPEPVRREEGGEEDGAPPSKRRKVAEEEDQCSVCLDPLESGLAAWPGCRHKFHGECVEKTLARNDMCPLCRRKLSDALDCKVSPLTPPSSPSVNWTDGGRRQHCKRFPHLRNLVTWGSELRELGTNRFYPAALAPNINPQGPDTRSIRGEAKVMESPAPPFRGGVMHMTSEDGRRLCITGLSLVDPAKARGQRVNVWAEVGHEKREIGKLSPKEPVVAVPPVVLGGEFVLRHDLAVPAAVQLHVRVLGPSASPDIEAEEEVIVLGEDEDEEDEEESLADDGAVGVGMEYELLSEEDMAELYDSDNEGGVRAGGSSRRDSVPLFAAPAGSVVPDGEFLGPARFTAVGNTAAFMRVAVAEAAADEEGKEIVVLYRYTRFSRTSGGRRGVEACRKTKLHRLRFAVPPAGDMVSSLAWAGSSLGPLIYPGLFRQQLQDLWTSLTAPAINTIPPRAARLQVIVDAGILRREDCTPERMAHMRGALATRMLDALPAYYHVGMELHLPEPVPANRMIAEGEEEECCVCFEVMESGLAAWPGCGHVFHGACAEKTLARSEMCPLCRHKLSDPLVHKNIKMRPQSAVCSVQ
ncbi:hypothetical protein BAE44_0011632 [Dichanthelium oligosanthes]|uniref:RING-type domain-containing protein n=1 Tax=Dichanthelium oligosanthes TaxID=888268 RepID=A0A1E5VQF8_9POAL|nr:hypothetical protein BAE44_0011632 [Dichanthelium oligosanthes]